MSSLRFCAGTITPGSDPKTNMIQRPEEVTYVEKNETFINTIDMEFVLIQPGELLWGHL
ncbi:MAG: hypothetical protein MIO93_05340 [ANME-2 cluster archaeon]|jgi:hypothetical protein|nr:hypothetical protein [ANME-2 cluster archaeon]